MQYSYRGYAIVAKVRVPSKGQSGGLVYQVVLLSDGWALGMFATFAQAQAAVDCQVQQAA